MCLVVLVASTNLANLILARAAASRRQLAIRRMLGASRVALVREQLFETAILAGCGAFASVGVAALLLQWWTTDISISPAEIVRLRFDVDGATLAFSLIAAAVSMVVFGLLPALYMTSGRRTELRSEGHVTPLTQTHWGMIRWQVATSAGLLLVAAACVSNVSAQLAHDPGVALQQLVVMNTDLGTDPRARTQSAFALRTVMDEATSQGHLNKAALAYGLPFGLNAPLATVSVAGQQSGHQENLVLVTASSGIFRALGVPLVRGRTFDEGTADDAAVVLSSQSAVTLFGGDNQAIGGRVIVTVGQVSTARTVIGVAADTDVVQFASRNGSVVWVPLREPYARSLALVAQSAADPSLALEQLRLNIGRVDPNLKMERSGVGTVLLTGPLGLLKFAAFLVTTLGAMTILLAVTGLFGVLSLSVTQRMRELGVRVALGASARMIERLVVFQGLKPVLEGLAVALVLGAVVRVGLNRLTGGHVQLFEPLSLAMVAVSICMAALLACYPPARHAGRVNPIKILKQL